MNRLRRLLDEARQQRRKLLSVFVTAGYPEREWTPDIVMGLGEAGADLVELGIPFSDPLADGPTIQHASQVALANGTTVGRALDQAAIIRRQSDLPLLLMGYVNPILKFGLTRFAAEAANAGVDGFIIPDLPPEESSELRIEARRHGLSLVFLAAPNTPESRLQQIDEWTDSFVYCVSVTGVTGARRHVPEGAREFLQRCRRILRHPYLVGFGISNGEAARRYRDLADGVIVGSAVIELLGGRGSLQERLMRVTTLVQEVKSALTETA